MPTRPLLALVALLAFPARGATWYVAPGGNDSWPGTLLQPWATVQHAADSVAAGDTVLIRAGTYNERVVLTAAGAPGAEITFAAYPGETPVLDGTRITLPDYLAALFEVSYTSYVRVRGLKVQNVGPYLESAGILVENGQHVVLEGNVTDDTVSSGIAVWGSQDVTLDGNEVIRACHGGIQEMITIGVTTGFVVVDNRVHDAGSSTIGGEGICLKDGSSAGRVHGNIVWNIPERLGIYVDAEAKHTFDIEVDGNVVYHCIDGIVLASEAGGLLENIRVTNNVCYANAQRGLTVADYGAVAARPMKDLAIVNNTFAGNGTGGWGGGIAVDDPQLQNVTVRNNVVSGNTSFTIIVGTDVPAGAVTVDHNLIDGFMGDTGETRGSDYVEGDPLFASTAASDFHLTAASPAVDHGSAVSAPAMDLDGLARPQGSAVDIGAFERPAVAAMAFYTVAPCRVLDTRNPAGPLAGPALAALATRVFAVGGNCGIPATAHAVSANVTVTSPAAPGFLTLYPGDGTAPLASTINFAPGATRANNAMLRLSSDGAGTLAFRNGSPGTVHAILDVNGYFE